MLSSKTSNQYLVKECFSLMMPRFLGQVNKLFAIGFILASLVHEAKGEVYINGTRGLKRHSGHGVAYANFAAHKFHHLNITPLLSLSVNEFQECGKLCVDHLSCFSFNGAAFRDMGRRILCELLPSDKYNKSSEFAPSSIFHRFSIKTPCFNHPCQNSATCVAKYEDNDYHCACAPGYSGRNCEIDVKECSSSPCLNGGTCVDGVNTFHCNCSAYFTGTRCETIDVPDPIALYPLNAAYNVSDMMANQPTGITSNVQLASGPDGNSQGSYQFLGVSNSYIELPNNGGLDTQYSITLCLWVYPEGQDGPVFNYKPSGAAFGVHLWVADGKLVFRPEKRSWEFIDAVEGNFTSNRQWNYVAASYDYNTGYARLFIDGAEVDKKHLGIYTLSTDDNVRMGVKSDDNRLFRGRIARVQVYNISLNLDQVLAVKARGRG